MYARARIQYSLVPSPRPFFAGEEGTKLRLGACETRFIAFEPITQAHALRLATASCGKLCHGGRRVCVCMHACVDWYGLEMVRTYVDVDHGRREAKYARAHS